MVEAALLSRKLSSHFLIYWLFRLLSFYFISVPDPNSWSRTRTGSGMHSTSVPLRQKVPVPNGSNPTVPQHRIFWHVGAKPVWSTVKTGLQYSGNRFTVQWKPVYSAVETGLKYSGNRFTVQWKRFTVQWKLVYSTVETGLQYSGNWYTVHWKPVYSTVETGIQYSGNRFLTAVKTSQRPSRLICCTRTERTT